MPSIPLKQQERPWIKREAHGRRAFSNASIYQSARWKALRKHHIQSSPLCVHCLKNDRTKAGWIVDHIVPINEGGEPFDESNLQSLCSSCHNIKSGKEAHSRRPKRA
jgi:5-methylcytosine-specific restriction protein A